MIDKVLLPLMFDADKLKSDVMTFAEHDWIAHFNTPYYSGDWSAIPFRSVEGDPKRILPDPTGKGIYQDTIHLLRCPYIHSVVNSLQCEKIDVRLLR